MNRTKKELIYDGLFGLLIGDALGVPYEFYKPEYIPPYDLIEFIPPTDFAKTYDDIEPGTWSDDGAQALCLLDSLLSCGIFDARDFGQRLLNWLNNGLWAVDGKVFDCGMQTLKALRALSNGTLPDKSGFCEPDGKGNGALMRVLPLALWHNGFDESLVEDAQKQSIVTHGHICNQVCCALYSLWVRYLTNGMPIEDSYIQAVAKLGKIYKHSPTYLHELRECTSDAPPMGTGYVVDSLISAKHLLFTYSSYESVVKHAVMLGNDTDTTAAIAGGLAGIAFGNIPERWSSHLRSRELVIALLGRM